MSTGKDLLLAFKIINFYKTKNEISFQFKILFCNDDLYSSKNSASLIFVKMLEIETMNDEDV